MQPNIFVQTDQENQECTERREIDKAGRTRHKGGNTGKQTEEIEVQTTEKGRGGNKEEEKETETGENNKLRERSSTDSVFVN